jgi:phosphate uptake regulator
MNVVKDIERVGDYVKNIYEVGQMMPDPPDRRLYQQWLQGRAKALEDLIALTGMATGAADEERAREVIQRTRQVATEAEEAIREVTGSDLPTRDAVCLVLLLRFFKRIAAHLGNVATAEVRPVDQLDFYDED